MTYKWCVVPQCTNTSIKSPEKMFVNLPSNTKLRKKWLILSRRNPKDIATKSHAFMCENHFNMEKDMANYTQYQMGFSKHIIMVKGAMPSKFECQLDRKRRLSDPTMLRTAYIKRLKTNIYQETKAEPDVPPGTSALNDDSDIPLMSEETMISTYCDNETSTEPISSVDKQTQTNIKVSYRSKAVQTKSSTRDICLSPFKIPTTSTMTSPFIITECDERSSLSGQVVNVGKKINFLNKEESDNDSTYLPSVVASSSSITSDSDIETNIVRQKTRCLKNMLYLISKKPLMYVGIPEDCYFIIKQISNQTKIPIKHILLCLKKIRLNSTFSELEDNFSVSLLYGSKLFLKNIPKIANVLRSFIVKLNKQSTLNTLPIAFRQNYYNVSCILDCLEIDIQKPSKALHQALTWSDYKKANTVKYLVSCTPNRLINFVSSGFGGRASAITVLENCKFLETLEPGTVVLADRGFKHVEQMLAEKGIKLLRPQSVTTGSKLLKDEVCQTKVIASLRIYVERVIRRIREFHMLKQHAVVNAKILRVLDHCIVIACGLINLQDSLIK